jgi:hypothetical protein
LYPKGYRLSTGNLGRPKATSLDQDSHFLSRIVEHKITATPTPKIVDLYKPTREKALLRKVDKYKVGMIATRIPNQLNVTLKGCLHEGQYRFRPKVFIAFENTPIL